MLLADRYLDRIDFLKYLPRTDCTACGAQTCDEFVDGLKRGVKKPHDCPDIPKRLYYPLDIALDADNILPKFPCVTDPRPGPTGVVEINGPDRGSPILVSGNHVHTQDVLTSVLSTTRSSFFLVFTDTKGNTVDMAVIFKTMTAGQIRKELETSSVFDRTPPQNIILPGLAMTVSDELMQSTGWEVIVGPICAAELPLFLADIWLPPYT